MATKKVKRRLNIKALLVYILVIYLFVMLVYYFLSRPIKNIYITGNEYLSDATIIENAGIKEYPSVLKMNIFKIKSNIEKMDYIKDVKVRRNLFGKLTIDVTEARALFYNRNNEKIVLSNGKEIDDDNSYGYPSLINYVPKKIYKKMIVTLDKIDYDILTSVSEMEYSVSRSGEKVLDDTRFIFRMNDGNTVYINLINIKNLNKYQEICATLDNPKGVMYLDSSSNENIYFKTYEAIQKEQEEKAKEEEAKAKEEAKKNE